MLRLASLVLVLTFLWPMVPPAQADTAPKVLVLGDSLVAWNRAGKRSIADVLARELGEPVKNRALSGARLIYKLPLTGAIGMNIGKQFRSQDRPDWVVLSGGGNDLWFGCGCNKCDRKLNKMLSGDGRKGAVVDLVSKIRKSGARVIMLGYLRSPGVGSPIESCKDEGDAYEARLTQMAKRIDGVHFLSNADLVPHGDRSFHGIDMIHPSIKGSKAIGKRVARLIKRLDQGR